MKTADYYHKWVEWNEEDNVYIGKCPDLITGIHGDDHVSIYGTADFDRVGRIASASPEGPLARPLAQ